MSDIHQQIEQQFPSDPIDHGQVGRLIMKAFPNAQSKRIGEEKTFIVGIELCATLQPTSESPEALLQVEKARVSSFHYKCKCSRQGYANLNSGHCSIHTTHFQSRWKQLFAKDKMYSMGQTLQHGLTIFHLQLSQMNFALSHLICSLCSIAWQSPNAMKLQKKSLLSSAR